MVNTTEENAFIKYQDDVRFLLIKELARLESRQKESVQIRALLQNILLDPENEKTSYKIGIEERIDDKAEEYIYKQDIQYREGCYKKELKIYEEFEFDTKGNIIDVKNTLKAIRRTKIEKK